MACSPYNSHTEPLFKTLGLLKIEDMLKLNTLNFIYKLNNNKLPVFFETYCYPSQLDIHGRNTRYNFLIPTNVTATNRGQKCVRNNIPWVINSTPRLILDKLDTHSYKGFSYYVIHFFLSVNILMTAVYPIATLALGSNSYYQPDPPNQNLVSPRAGK